MWFLNRDGVVSRRFSEGLLSHQTIRTPRTTTKPETKDLDGTKDWDSRRRTTDGTVDMERRYLPTGVIRYHGLRRDWVVSTGTERGLGIPLPVHVSVLEDTG